MPILNAEIQCHPHDLLTQLPQDDAQLLHDGARRRWWVLHSKARQEKSIARDLLSDEISFYLPQVRKTLMIRGRKHHSFVPLFTSYVFLYGNERERHRAMTTNRVAYALPVPDEEELRRELLQISQLIQVQAPLTMESRLSAGDPVRVRSGPLAGIEGTVIERRKKCRLLVAVRLLQRGDSQEIDDFLLTPLR